MNPYIRPPYPNELYHHGIKGQKWGIRRFQNPDGTLTPAGKKRYDKSIEKKLDERVQELTNQGRDLRSAGLEAVSQLSVKEIRSRVSKTLLAGVGAPALAGGAAGALAALGAIGAFPVGAALASAGEIYAIANMVKAFKNVSILSEAGTHYKYMPDKKVKTVNVT